jgi:RNA polymerase sporulation-specific sigma factor
MYTPIISRFFEMFCEMFFAFGHMVNTNSFPKPLTAAEEIKYIEQWHEGSLEARNVLVERNLRLVAHVVKKYSNNQDDIDDLISVGTIGLIKAINTFNNKKGTKLATYAAKCIENEILMQIRSNARRKSEVSLQDPIGQDNEGNEITLCDIICKDQESIVDEVNFKICVQTLRSGIDKLLSPREKVVMQLRYGICDGYERTQLEVSKMLGISRSYISRIEKKAMAKLSEGVGKGKSQ